MFIDFEKYPFAITDVTFADEGFSGKYQYVSIDTDGGAKFKIEAFGDCCSVSVISEWENFKFSEIIGKTIESLEQVKIPDNFEVEPDDDLLCFGNCATPHLYEFLFTDGSTFKFIMVNYSNGYYDGWIDVSVIE